jgi:type I restriction enzyme S subunit
MSLGKIARPRVPVAINQDLKALFLHEGVNKTYIEYAWRASEARIREMGTGTTVKGIRLEDIRGLQVPLAPTNEQTRIADHLDTLLARIKACNDHLDTIPTLLKRFRQAVLNAALAGMLADGDGEASRQIVKVSDIATVGTGSTPLRSNGSFYASTGTPWVTSAATGAAYISSADQFVTPAAIAAHRLKVYPKGTLLVAMYGEGKTRGQVSELAIDATINQACAAICVDKSRALTSFVKIALAANYLAMRELAEGGNQPNLNLSKIKDFEIPLPSIEEQAAVVKRADALLAKADRIEALHSSARSQTNQLAPRVLAKAFRGELLPQDPNDEPASALLARLSEERNQASTAPKARKTRVPRAERTLPFTSSPSKAMPNKSRQDEDVKGQPYLAAHLRRLGQPVDAKTLYEVSDLPVADFYKQLAWEIAKGHVKDADPLLEPARHAA